MNSSWAFGILLLISGAGFLLGLFYYTNPEKVVMTRIKSEHNKTAQKDAEFRKWLDAEKEMQIRRTRRMGLTILIFEAIFIVFIFGLWKQSLG